MTGPDRTYRASSRATRQATALALAGVVATVAGAFVDPDRLWSNWLLVAYYVLGLALAGVFFVALQYASGATWSIAFRRVPEAMAATLPAGIAAMAIALVARPSLYPWTGRIAIGAEEGVFRQAWLNWPFFLARAAAYCAVWAAFATLIVRTSRRQDADGAPGLSRTNAKLSAVFLVLFAVTFSLASFDWVMSREPHWYSTMFAVYNFAGLFLGGLAALVVIAVWLERAGPLRGVLRDDHLHDLGKLMFAFSTFWMYIWFSQYMLIWYANIPEESAYFIARTRQTWEPLFYANVALNWVVPFAVLLRRDFKRQRQTLVRVAVVLLVGRWLDLYQLVLPPVAGSSPSLGWIEIGVVLGGIGLFLLALHRALAAAPLVPRRDPMLHESLHYHA